MRILDNGDIWIAQKEVFPIYCSKCEFLFQPGEKNLEIVDCPNCQAEIITQNAPQLCVTVGGLEPPKKARRRRAP